jgi:hypothetical protein
VEGLVSAGAMRGIPAPEISTRQQKDIETRSVKSFEINLKNGIKNTNGVTAIQIWVKE